MDYFNQIIECPECGNKLKLKEFPVVPSTGKLKKTCCLTSGDNSKKKYLNRIKETKDGILIFCNNCKKHKKSDEYHKDKNRYKNICKKCHNEKYKDYVSPSHRKRIEQTRIKKIKKDNQLIFCKKCNKSKKYKYWDRDKSGNLSTTCCSSSGKIIEKKLRKRFLKKCKTCLKIKSLEYFNKRSAKCKECQKIYVSLNGNREKRKSWISETDDGTLNNEVLRNMYSESKHCLICKTAIKWRDKNLDHIVPLSKGGAHSIKNVMIICKDCNTKKSNKDFLDFFSSLNPEAKNNLKNYFANNVNLKHIMETINDG